MSCVVLWSSKWCEKTFLSRGKVKTDELDEDDEEDDEDKNESSGIPHNCKLVLVARTG